MDLRILKNKFIEANIVTDDIKVIFRLPGCKSYDDCNCHIANINGNNVLVVDLIDKIEPIFKVGDVVTSSSGLYPNVKCTISIVDEEKQCYYFREVAGITYFKDQDKLILADNIEPKFKAGDKVKGVSSENPEKIFVINFVNTSNKCYHYFNGNCITTSFKDQDKLTLVKDDEVRPPVEGISSISYKYFAHHAIANVVNYNITHYNLIENVSKQIIAMSKAGDVSYHLVVPMKKEADEEGIYYIEDEVCGIIRWHFDKLGYKIEEKVKDNHNEFFITW